MLPGGLPSPGAPTGFTGRIVFANTGTPQRVANGTGDFSPAAGFVPTGLYLNGGGGDNAPVVQPVRPAAPPALPMPGVFFQPGPGIDGLDIDLELTDADVALSNLRGNDLIDSRGWWKPAPPARVRLSRAPLLFSASQVSG